MPGLGNRPSVLLSSTHSFQLHSCLPFGVSGATEGGEVKHQTVYHLRNQEFMGWPGLWSKTKSPSASLHVPSLWNTLSFRMTPLSSILTDLQKYPDGTRSGLERDTGQVNTIHRATQKSTKAWKFVTEYVLFMLSGKKAHCFQFPYVNINYTPL